MATFSFGVLFVLAFIMSIEFGQTAIEIVRRGVKHGLKSALLVSFGAATAELCFLALTATGFILFFNNPGILKFVWLGGGLVVFYLGIQGLRHYRVTALDFSDRNLSPWPFATGFAINFLHPLNILWWAGTLGPIMLESMQQHGNTIGVLSGLGVPAGALMWWVILSFTASRFKQALSTTYLQTLNVVSSVGLCALGVYFFFKAFSLFFN